ncbi:MAG: hypothetical protein JWR05_236 [Mucilaginibacter sp.]|nr:hypothetical protein [Mucilaginibacter sp.]
MIQTFLPDTYSQLLFSAVSYRQFFSEFEGKMLRVDMDKKYRVLIAGIQQALHDVTFYRSAGLLKVSRPFLQSLSALDQSVQTDVNDKEDFLRSIIHIHLNRLFTDDARKRERIVYYLLHKFLLSEKGRSRQNR